MKARTTLGCFVVVLAVLSVGVVAASILAGKSRARAEAHFAKLRAGGYPTSPKELDAWYVKPPEAENGATALLEAIQAHTLPPPSMDESAPSIFTLRGEPELPEPDTPLTEAQRSLAADYLKDNEPTLRLLQESLNHTAFRFPIDLTAGFATELPHLTGLRALAYLLETKATVEADMGNADDAVQTVQMLLRFSDVLADEPLLISQLVRLSCHSIAVSALAQVVGRADLSTAQLEGLKEALKTYGERDTLYRGMAGEFANGMGVFGEGFPVSQGPREFRSVARGAASLYSLTLGPGDRSFYISKMTEIIEVCRVPVEQRRAQAKAVEAEIERGMSWKRAMSRILLPSLSRGTEAGIRDAAMFRCALTALAIEQYRLDHGGALPETLEGLVPQYLTEVPQDPYCSQPLRYRSLSPGYAVYSVGEDLADDGVEVESNEDGRSRGRSREASFRVDK